MNAADRPDLLVVNARIHSLEREGERFSAMAVKDGKITQLFDESPVAASVLRAREVLDLQGRAVLPGLIDGHMHFLAASVLREAAMSVADMDIAEMEGAALRGQTLAQIGEKIRAYAKGAPANRPVFCFNCIIDAVAEKRLPNRTELDAWLPGRQVIVLSMDGHSSAYSSSALRRLDLLEQCPGGILSGAAHELSMGKVNALIAGSVSLPRLFKGIQGTVNEAVEQGLVCLHCLEGFEDSRRDPSVWLLSRLGGTLPIDLRLWVQYRDPARVLPFARFLRNRRIGGCYGWAMDGSISSGTAAFDEPYRSDAGNRGTLYFTADEARRLVSRATGAGFQVTSHAIGTAAIERLLCAYESVLTGGKNPARHRIDHFEFPTPDQVERAARLGLPLIIQPGFAWLDDRFVHCYERQLTDEQYNRQTPMRSIRDAGGLLVGSSDCPAGLLSPWIQMQGMVDFPRTEQSIGLYEALRTYTWNAAWTTGEETVRGTLAPGKKADFIVMEKDPFEMPPDALYTARVRQTFIDGRPARRMDMSAGTLAARSLFGPRRKM